MSRFWQRRIYEVAFLLSVAIGSLYVIPKVTDIAASGPFSVSMWVAVGAGITALLSIVLYIFSPKEPSYIPPFIVYILFTATLALLVLQTGGASSPFIALWMLVAFFSGVFAIWGALIILLATGVYIAFEYLGGNLSVGAFTLIAIISIVPTLISLLIWRKQEMLDESTKNVRHLTNQLSEIASKSEIVINAIGDGVVAVDSVGVVQLINPAAQQILGWGKQDALALNYKSVLRMLDANNHELDPNQDPIAEVLNTNQLNRAPGVIIQTKSDKKIMASMVVSPIGEAGSGVIAVFRDVTKEKAEEREQAEFISTASHEMRTPVASIEGYLGLALNPNTATVDPKARDFILKAHEAAQHLGRLFQDLLDVSKTEDGRMTNIPKVIDLAPFTETIVEGLQSKAQEKGLVMTFVPGNQRAQRTLVPVYYVNQDNDHIREILNNLIENAIKYTPKGEIKVDIEATEEKVTISVADSGLGIPPEDISHLFQKFYRVSNVDRQEIGGTGLGLYLSRRLAEAIQGRLWVESVYGQGSTFFFEVPRISTDEAEHLKLQQQTQKVPAAQGPSIPFPREPLITVPQTTPVDTSRRTDAVPERPATVPRGESLTREQIAERVRQLEAMARSKNSPQAPAAPPTVAPQPTQTPVVPPPEQQQP